MTSRATSYVVVAMAAVSHDVGQLGSTKRTHLAHERAAVRQPGDRLYLPSGSAHPRCRVRGPLRLVGSQPARATTAAGCAATTEGRARPGPGRSRPG